MANVNIGTITVTFTVNTRGMSWRMKVVGMMLKFDCWLQRVTCRLMGKTHVNKKISVSIDKYDDDDGGA
jgi:hypothetical protein